MIGVELRGDADARRRFGRVDDVPVPHRVPQRAELRFICVPERAFGCHRFFFSKNERNQKPVIKKKSSNSDSIHFGRHLKKNNCLRFHFRFDRVYWVLLGCDFIWNGFNGFERVL